jgi:SAM-dependent methyltransferase
MHVLGLYRYFASFVARHVPIDGPLSVLDLGCGAAQLAGPLDRAFAERGAFLQHYTGVDFADPEWMPARIEREFSRTGLADRGAYLHHDLNDKLPDLALRSEPLVITSCWCMTYLGPVRVASLLEELTQLVARRPEPTRVLLNMLTGGRFDRRVLTKRFLTEVVPRQLWAAASRFDVGPARDLRLAMKALPRMRAFGDELAEHVTLMTVPEVIDVVQNVGCVVEAVDATALWGQTTSLALRLPHR